MLAVAFRRCMVAIRTRTDIAAGSIVDLLHNYYRNDITQGANHLSSSPGGDLLLRRIRFPAVITKIFQQTHANN